MKKFILLFAVLIPFACVDEPDTDLSGEWHFNEPPQQQFRNNRLDGTTPAFDALFTVNVRTITDSDLWINGAPVDETFHSVDHGQKVDFIFEYQDFNLKLLGCRKRGAMMFADRVEYTLSPGNTSTYEGVSIGLFD